MIRGFIPLLLGGLLAGGAQEIKTDPPDATDEGDYAFGDVIKATTGFAVLTFDPADPAQAGLLKRLQQAARLAMKQANVNGIRKARANEVGNAMETFVMDAFKELTLPAERPTTQSGRTLSVGYPDLQLDTTPPCYLELKTFNEKTARSTQRTFYYSPSDDPKITRDSLHLLLAFQMEAAESEEGPVWRAVRYRITSLQALTVRLKIEYNQGNRALYEAESVLAEETAP